MFGTRPVLAQNLPQQVWRRDDARDLNPAFRSEVTMFLRMWRFITLILAALNMGLAFCHLMEMPAKMQYDASLYATINNNLYLTFGSAPGIAIEIGSIVAAVGLVFLVRQRRLSFPSTLIGAICLLAAQVIWWVFIAPVNAEIRTWTSATVPADWTQLRNQWEYAHASRFVLQLLGLSALTLSIIRETPVEQSAPATVRPEVMRSLER
jgi:Domain of unknown function (DUF1772)